MRTHRSAIRALCSGVGSAHQDSPWSPAPYVFPSETKGLLMRRVLGVALIATMAVIAIPATAGAKTVKAKDACALLAAGEVGRALGATSVAGAVTKLPTQVKGVTATECSWTADGASTVALGVDLLRGPGMKSLYDQSTTSSGTTPVSGVGKAAKFGAGLGLVILVDATTAIRLTGPTQPVDETLAKLAVPRATGAKKPATSLSTGGATAAPGSSGSGKVSVDLAITGDLPATIKGTKGRCNISSNDPMSSGYDFEAADYPSLGANGAFSVEGGQLRGDGGRTYPNIKANIGGGGFLVFDSSGSGLTISANGKTVTFNMDLDGSDAAGTPVLDHVSGTITCS
jgi:hypothetical protein